MSLSKRMIAARIPDDRHPLRAWFTPDRWRLLHGANAPPVADPKATARASMAPGWIEIRDSQGTRFTRAEITPTLSADIVVSDPDTYGTAAAREALHPAPITLEEARHEVEQATAVAARLAIRAILEPGGSPPAPAPRPRRKPEPSGPSQGTLF